MLFRTAAGVFIAAFVATGAVAQPSTDIYLGTLAVGSGSAVVVTGLTNVTNRIGYDNQPFFGPSGDWFFYASADTAGSTDIYRYDIAAGESHRVTDTPESEYSPTILPTGDGFSSVRVEADSTQRLWRFDLDGTNPQLVLPDITEVGYHAWIDRYTVVLFIVGNPHELHAADIRTGSDRLLGRPTDRALNTIPGKELVSCVLQAPDESWSFFRARADADSIATIDISVPLLPGSRDCAWLPDGRVIMFADGIIYAIDPDDPAPEWREAFSLADSGLDSVTRMAVSPAGNRIAIVAADAE